MSTSPRDSHDLESPGGITFRRLSDLQGASHIMMTFDIIISI